MTQNEKLRKLHKLNTVFMAGILLIGFALLLSYFAIIDHNNINEDLRKQLITKNEDITSMQKQVEQLQSDVATISSLLNNMPK